MPGQLRSALAFLCLSLTAAQMEGASITGADKKFPRAHNAKNGKLTITADKLAPGIHPSGNIKLATDKDTNENNLSGNYRINGKVLTANFNIERGWNEIIYRFISGEPFGQSARQLRKPISIPPVLPNSLVITADPKLTRDNASSFLATTADVPPSDATICDHGLYLLESKDSAPVSQQVQWSQKASFTDKKLGLAFQLDRSSGEQPDLDAVLELCQGSDRLVYRGRLPRAAVSYELKVRTRPQENASLPRSLILSFTGLPVSHAEPLDAKVIEGAGGISALSNGKTITFNQREDFYQSEVPYSCSSDEVNLPKLLLVAHDSKGQYVLRSSSGVTLCPGLSPSVHIKIVWWALGSLFLLAVCLIIWRQRSRFPFRRAEKSPSGALDAPPSPLPEAGNPPLTDFPKNTFPNGWKTSLAEILYSQLEPLYGTIRDINNALRQMLNQQTQLLAATDKLPPVETSTEIWRPGKSSFPAQPISSEPETALTNLINRWLADGADRDRLSSLIQQDPSIKSYRPSNLQDSLRSSTNRTFQFQPSGGPIEWLGRMQQGDLFLAPGDPRLFQTGDSLKFLGVLFDGLGSSLSNVRFRRVVKACRLKREPGSSDRYRVVDRGILELEGRTTAETPTPATRLALPKQDLPEITRGAIGEAVPSGLQAQIQDLIRQVRALAESGSPQLIQAPKPDANIAATLSAIRQEVSMLSQRMNAIESMVQVVESLGGSLTRIEAELRNLSSQPPPLVSPVAPPTDLPPKGGSKRSLQSEDPLEEMLRGMKERTPATVAPVPLQALASPDQPSAPEQLWAKLQRWWPRALNSRIRDDYFDGEPSAAYLWGLDELKKALTGAVRDRGWQVDVVHVKVPDNSPTGEPILQIHEPRSIEDRRVVCACVPTSPFSGALLFQFALRIHGDEGQDIAVLPAPGLRLAGSTEGYARLAGGELPGNATSLVEVIRPAILGWSGSGDLFTVALPMQAKFR